jgi:hypothetical protein
MDPLFENLEDNSCCCRLPLSRSDTGKIQQAKGPYATTSPGLIRLFVYILLTIPLKGVCTIAYVSSKLPTYIDTHASYMYAKLVRRQPLNGIRHHD